MQKMLCLGVLIIISLLSYSQNIGVGTASPSQKLHVNGKIKLGDDAVSPSAGTLRFNTTNTDFEGFNGSDWLSLTAGSSQGLGTGNDLGKLKDYTVGGSPTPVASDRFGDAVDISGEWAVVGCRADGASGAAHVFRKVGVDWVHFLKVTPAVVAVGASFGTSVAIDGNYFIVGAPYDEPTGQLLQGAAWIFFYNGTTWVEQQKITNGGNTGDEWYGSSVDISGDWAVVGAPQVDDFANVDEGKAYTYRRSGVVWSGNGVFSGSGGSGNDYYGNGVAIDGNYFIVGAPFYKTGGVSIGAAHTYFWNGSAWTTQTKLLPSNGLSGDLFGFSVAISGNQVVVGAREHDGDFNNSGAGYIFSRSGTTWSQKAYLISPDGNANAGFGTSVAISGDICIIGDPGFYRKNACGTNITSNEGQAYVFKKIGSIWEDYLTIFLPKGRSGDNLGSSVTIDGLDVAATAPTADVNGLVDSGKVIFGKVD